MSDFESFLTGEYASHFGVMWNTARMSVRKESPAAIRFEIEDQQPTIVQPAGKGVSVYRRTEESVEIIDIDDFTKQVHGTANTPSSCDFAVTPVIGTSFLILNELTRTKSGYILRFRQPDTGEEQDGKLEKARHQLTNTINRFYEVSDFCDCFNDKIALFSCRLSDKPSKGIMARSAKMFNRTIDKLQRMILHEELPHGFVFKMRVYDVEYKLV